MITLEGDRITRTDPHRHKFGNAIAEYLYVTDMMRDHAEAHTGDVEAPTGHVSLYGRRLMFGDSQGFVSVETYPEARGARQVFDAIEAWYGDWANDDPDDDDVAERLDQDAAYCAYVIACAVENLEALDRDAWKVNGMPRGPLG